MPALILMYHDLCGASGFIQPEHRPYVLEASDFRKQMSAIAESGISTMTVTEWCSTPVSPNAVLITFDDGHVSSHDIALPILLENDLRATIFVTAGSIGHGTTMSWQQLRALKEAGMEIGSHTLTHRPPATLDDDTLRNELVVSRQILEDGLGAPVNSISSPTGFFNPRMSVIAREVGYRALCFGRIGLVESGGDTFALNRVAVKRGISDEDFSALLRFDTPQLRRLRRKQWVRDMARKVLRPDDYVRLRKLLLRKTSP